MILLSLSAEHQRQLVDSVTNIVREVDATDAVEMLALLSGPNLLLKGRYLYDARKMLIFFTPPRSPLSHTKFMQPRSFYLLFGDPLTPPTVDVI